MAGGARWFQQGAISRRCPLPTSSPNILTCTWALIYYWLHSGTLYPTRLAILSAWLFTSDYNLTKAKDSKPPIRACALTCSVCLEVSNTGWFFHHICFSCMIEPCLRSSMTSMHCLRLTQEGSVYALTTADAPPRHIPHYFSVRGHWLSRY